MINLLLQPQIENYRHHLVVCGDERFVMLSTAPTAKTCESIEKKELQVVPTIQLSLQRNITYPHRLL